MHRLASWNNACCASIQSTHIPSVVLLDVSFVQLVVMLIDIGVISTECVDVFGSDPPNTIL